MITLRVLDILQERNLSKYWLYKRMDMSYQNINRMVTNETSAIRYDTLEKLSTVLNCSVGELFCKTEDEKNKRDCRTLPSFFNFTLRLFDLI